MAKSEVTSRKIASAASKVLRSKTVTKGEKAVSASALTKKGSTEKTSVKATSSAAKILGSKTASKAAKSAAASALTQRSSNDRIIRDAADRFDDVMKSLAKR